MCIPCKCALLWICICLLSERAFCLEVCVVRIHAGTFPALCLHMPFCISLLCYNGYFSETCLSCLASLISYPLAIRFCRTNIELNWPRPHSRGMSAHGPVGAAIRLLWGFLSPCCTQGSMPSFGALNAFRCYSCRHWVEVSEACLLLPRGS